jgi:hypothetical protein
LDPSKLHFVYLTRRKWVEDKTWPVFTLLGQSLGSMYLAWEAMSLFIPDLYIGASPSSYIRCIGTGLTFGHNRYDGLRFHLPRRCLAHSFTSHAPIHAPLPSVIHLSFSTPSNPNSDIYTLPNHLTHDAQPRPDTFNQHHQHFIYHAVPNTLNS